MGGGRDYSPPPPPPPLPPPLPPLLPPLLGTPFKLTKPPPRTCSGTTKQGLPCRIAWQLDALGYCKYHTQLTRQCRGIARTTGKRCRIRWDLDANGYCQYHRLQALTVSTNEASQCVALALSTGQRCRITSGLDASGLCSVHQRTSSSAMGYANPPRVCCGNVLHTGEPCMNDAKPGYDYCCAAHDPSRQYFSPRLFDASDKPRSLLEPHVVRLYNGRDLYHDDLLDLVTPGYVELDHILEKQCFAFAFHGIEFDDVTNDAMYLASIVRDECANDLANVCLTRTTTNKIKGAAVWKFLDDTITGHRQFTSRTFTDYMVAEKRDDKRLERATTQAITREMGRALMACQNKLTHQGETPLVDALSRELQRVYVAMDLKSAGAVVVDSRYDAAARPKNTRITTESEKLPVRKRSPSKSTLAAAVHAKAFVPCHDVGSNYEKPAEPGKNPSSEVKTNAIVENCASDVACSISEVTAEAKAGGEACPRDEISSSKSKSEDMEASASGEACSSAHAEATDATSPSSTSRGGSGGTEDPSLDVLEGEVASVHFESKSLPAPTEMVTTALSEQQNAKPETATAEKALEKPRTQRRY